MSLYVTDTHALIYYSTAQSHSLITRDNAITNSGLVEIYW